MLNRRTASFLSSTIFSPLLALTASALVGTTVMISAPAMASAAEIDDVKSAMLDDALSNAGFREQTAAYHGTEFDSAQSYLDTIQSNGSWSDINYGDKTNAFPALKHLDRMLVWAYVYNKPGNALYQNAGVLSSFNRALGYWYQVNPTCSNWFKNRIAKQFYLGPIGLMMQPSIDSSSLNKIIGDLTDAPDMTGANRTALSTSVIYRAVLEGNNARLAAGVEGVASVITVTAGDGIQRDSSFQQHGGILYNGNYGYGFLRDVTWVGAMLSGTSFAFSAGEISLLRDNFLEGTRWMIRNRLLDFNVRGREVGTSSGGALKAETFLRILEHFATIDPEHATDYDKSFEAITLAQSQEVRGVRHFWNSDYTAVQQEGNFTSLKMCSKRLRGMERNVNTENLMGYWLPYGLTYTYQVGDEYQSIFPVWDWARLPGVTNPHVEISFSDNSTTYTSQNTSFVGGASDGRYGASAMDFSLEQTTARKSWFWFEREWVALGAGIESSHQAPIFTSVQQILLKGPVIVAGDEFTPGEATLDQPTWVYHDGIGYRFPTGQAVQLRAGEQTGNMKRIFGLGSDALLKKDVFSLWFDHGTRPSDASYAYTVIPGMERSTFEHYVEEQDAVGILANTASLQAVNHSRRRITAAVFFSPGQIGVENGPQVEVDRPSIVVLNEPDGTVTVSDPTQSLSALKVTVTNLNGEVRAQDIQLPGGDRRGQSVVVDNLLEVREALPEPVDPTVEVPGSGGASTGEVGSSSGGTSDSGGGSATSTGASSASPDEPDSATNSEASTSSASGCSCTTESGSATGTGHPWGMLLMMAAAGSAIARRKQLRS